MLKHKNIINLLNSFKSLKPINLYIVTMTIACICINFGLINENFLHFIFSETSKTYIQIKAFGYFLAIIAICELWKSIFNDDVKNKIIN